VAAAGRRLRRALACRPTDALEPWRIPVDAQLRALAAAAVAAGVAFETAAGVVAERSLVVAEHGLTAPQIADLDGRARAARPRTELSAASAAYLRELGSTRAVAPRLGTSVTLALPARLNDRIGSPARLPQLLDADTLAAALAWERAAMGAGLTLTEWALGELLELRG
jgi:hypothetical protein